MVTSIRADIAESVVYNQALQRGEIGLQRAAGANVRGPDFITAAREGGIWEIILTDVKSSVRGQFPTPAAGPRPDWLAEAEAAIAPGRLNLNNPALEQQIRDAFLQGRVRLRQIDVNYSPTGQGRITGW